MENEILGRGGVGISLLVILAANSCCKSADRKIPLLELIPILPVHVLHSSKSKYIITDDDRGLFLSFIPQLKSDNFTRAIPRRSIKR